MLTPEEREALNQCVRTLMHLGMQDHVETIASLRDRLDAAEPVYQVWTSEDSCQECWEWKDTDKAEYDSFKESNRRILYTAPPAPAAPRVPDGLLEQLTRYDFEASNIFKRFYPNAKGDFVDLKELRALLAAAPRNEQGGE